MLLGDRSAVDSFFRTELRPVIPDNQRVLRSRQTAVPMSFPKPTNPENNGGRSTLCAAAGRYLRRGGHISVRRWGNQDNTIHPFLLNRHINAPPLCGSLAEARRTPSAELRPIDAQLSQLCATGLLSLLSEAGDLLSLRHIIQQTSSRLPIAPYSRSSRSSAEQATFGRWAGLDNLGSGGVARVSSNLSCSERREHISCDHAAV
jgi:hypothetical protein